MERYLFLVVSLFRYLNIFVEVFLSLVVVSDMTCSGCTKYQTEAKLIGTWIYILHKKLPQSKHIYENSSDKKTIIIDLTKVTVYKLIIS